MVSTAWKRGGAGRSPPTLAAMRPATLQVGGEAAGEARQRAGEAVASVFFVKLDFTRISPRG